MSKSKVKEVGRVKYIDPNAMTNSTYMGNNTIPHAYEDYCISVDLTVTTYDRDMCGHPQDSPVKEYKYSSDKGTISFLNGKDGYFSTDYTDVSMSDPESNTMECLGIDNIHITYGPWMYPQVTIKFVDVRGASLFGPSEQQFNRNVQKKRNGEEAAYDGGSFFKALFTYPYPLFTLKVKGYYGKEITYKLALESFNTDFDSERGNFNVTCEFKGFMYGIYTDIPMVYLALAPYIDIPENGNIGAYWKSRCNDGSFKYLDFRDKDGNIKEGRDMYTYPQLRKEIATARKTADEAVKESEASKTLDNIRKRQELISDAISAFPIADSNAYNWHCVKKDTQYAYFHIASLIARDVYDEVHLPDGKSVKDFKEKCMSVETYEAGFYERFSTIINGLEEKLSEKSGQEILIWKPKYKIEIDNEGRKTFFSVGLTENELTPISKESLSYLNGSEEGYLDTYLKRTDISDNIYIYELISDCDFEKTAKQKIEGLAEQETEALNEVENVTTKKVAEILGFQPSIENVFRMSFAHMNTFIHAYYKCLDEIYNKKISGERTFKALKDYGIKPSNTDKSNASSDDFMPPFPYFIKEDSGTENGTAKKEITWVGDVIGEENAAQLDEVKLVNKIIKAAKLYGETQEEVTEEIERIAKEDYSEKENVSTMLADYIPTLPYEICNVCGGVETKNPYEVFANNNKSDVLERLLFIFALRVYNYYVYNDMGTDTKQDKIAQAFGAIEASNFSKVVEKLNLNIKRSIFDRSNDLLRGDFQRYVNTYLSDAHDLRTMLTSDNYGIKKTTSFLNCDVNEYKWIESTGGTDTYLPTCKFNPEDIKKDITEGNLTSSENNYPCYINFKKLSAMTNSCVVFEDTDRLSEIYENLKNCNNEIYCGITISSKLTKQFTEKSINVLDKLGKNKEPYENALYRLDKKGNVNLLSYKEIDEYKDNGFVYFPSVCYKYNISNGGNNIVTERNPIFATPFYVMQDRVESKAYLYLMSVPFNGKPEKNLITSDLEGGIFPELYLLREGAFYWRYDMCEKQGTEPLVYSNGKTYNFKQMSSTEIPYTKGASVYGFSNMCVYNKTDENVEYVNIDIPSNVGVSRKEVLKERFIQWANDSVSPTGFTGGVAKYLEFKISGVTVNDPDVLMNPDSVFDCSVLSPYESMGSVAKNQKFVRTGVKLKTNPSLNSQKDILLPLYIKKLCIFDFSVIDSNNTNKMKVNKYRLNDAFIYFIKQLRDIYKEQLEDLKEYATLEDEITAETESNGLLETKKSGKDIKQAVYMTLKTLYDRWFCSRSSSCWDYSFNLDTLKDSEFKNVMYMDSYYHNIGEIFPCNVTEISNVMDSHLPTTDATVDSSMSMMQDMSLYHFWANICERHQMLFLALPALFGLSAKEQVEEMFTPYPWNQMPENDSSCYLCLYTYKPSEHLSNVEDTGYEDDSFDLADGNGELYDATSIPDYLCDSNGRDIPAFGVTFAKQNQSYFKNISLKTNNTPQTTESVIRSTMQIASKASLNPSELTMYGQDMYKVWAGNAYACTVTMMGCAQILPYMYFQLNNIPMWRGAYLIYQVEHSISAGKMETTFTGNRVNKYSLTTYDDEIEWLSPKDERESTNDMEQNNGNEILITSSQLMLRIVRTGETSTCTTGDLYLNGTKFARTLEPFDPGFSANTYFNTDDEDTLTKIKMDTMASNASGRCSIPAGIYSFNTRVKTNNQSLLKSSYEMNLNGIYPRLENVPQFEGILIHHGNTVEASHGCILIGELDKGDAYNISNTRNTLKSLMAELEKYPTDSKMTIEIKRA